MLGSLEPISVAGESNLGYRRGKPSPTFLIQGFLIHMLHLFHTLEYVRARTRTVRRYLISDVANGVIPIRQRAKQAAIDG